MEKLLSVRWSRICPRLSSLSVAAVVAFASTRSFRWGVRACVTDLQADDGLPLSDFLLQGTLELVESVLGLEVLRLTVEEVGRAREG